MMNKRLSKLAIWTLAIIFIMMNVIACLHGYKFTHYSNSNISKTKSAEKLSVAEKVKTLFLGVNNPRPKNKTRPAQKFSVVKLQSNKMIECWSIPTESAKGTIILFHGYSGEKSSQLTNSDEFVRLGYNTFLVDFMGSGGSEGNQTTIGFKEAEEVKTAFNYITSKGDKNVYLFGTSMGAAAILKAIHDYKINPKGIIIECPFGTMYQTTCARFNSLHVPTFPMAGLLDFWGGIENGFWAFGHNPTEYAKSVRCPTLLMYGAKDEKVSRQEINDIYINLGGTKSMAVYPLAGHESYLNKYKQQWIEDIKTFLEVSPGS